LQQYTDPKQPQNGPKRVAGQRSQLQYESFAKPPAHAAPNCFRKDRARGRIENQTKHKGGGKYLDHG
jgi:hypothetical protein